MIGLRDALAAFWLAYRAGLALPRLAQRIVHPTWQVRR